MEQKSQENASDVEVKKKFELAKECIDSERYDEAISALHQLIEIKPDAGQAFVMLGNVHYKLGQVDDALLQFEKAISINPKLSSAMVMIGNIYSEFGDSEKAIGFFDSAIEQNPKLIKAQIKASKIDIEAERLDEAEQRCREAIKYNPQLLTARLMLASIFMKKGELSSAETECRSAITINGSVIVARLMLGNICMQQKRFAEAEEAFDEALKLNPEAGLARLYLMRGLASYALSNSKAAEQSFSAALKEHDGLTIARNMLIKCYIQQERYELALEEARKLAKSKAKPMIVHRLLGEIYSCMGEYGIAVEEFNAAINHAPKLLEKYPELGEVAKVYQDDKARSEAYKNIFEQVISSRSAAGGKNRKGKGGRSWRQRK